MTRAMKDSGVEWIGKIPENWSVLKAKYVIMQNDGGVWGDEPIEGLENKIVLRSTEQTIDGKWNIFEPATRYLNNVPYKAAKIKKGDLLITKSSGSSLHIGKTTLADEYFDTHECYYSNFLQRIHPNNKILAQYLWYIYNSPISREQFVYHQNSTIGIGNINSTDIENIIVPLPKKEEQYAIITYLDKKCGEIDAITAKIQEQIATLEEYKKSVITEAVTKGLNPNTPMKDSGIEWNPTIPSHWNTINPKALFKLRTQRANKDDEQLTSSQKHGIISQKKFMEIENQKVVTVEKDFDILKHVEPNDFVISMRSFQGGLEYSEVRGCISSAYVMLIPVENKVYPPFYKWFFKSSKYINAIQSTSNLIRDGQAMRYANFVQVKLFDIPYHEQEEIAEYLDNMIFKIDSILDNKQKQVETLEEYKKTLIYEYVTGKKEAA